MSHAGDAGTSARPAPTERGPDGEHVADAPTAPADRAAALAAGSPGIPTNFVLWVLGIVLVLSLGGLLAEHLFSTAGLNPKPPATPTTLGPTRTQPAAAPQLPATGRSLDAPLAAFMGLSTPRPAPAPAFTLTDQAGRSVSVPARPPKVVVLTFFNASCDDICPVLAAELRKADSDLGPRAGEVEFVTVNTDPAALAASAAEAVLERTALGSLPNWRMVTGPLASLNAVWTAYGVSVSLYPKTGLVVHNDVLAFIDDHGDLRYRATPFGDESSKGVFSLPAATVARWGTGIATYAGKLIGR